MKKTFSHYFLMIILATMLLPSLLVAEPVVSYIIPDIGSPGMATYMEIISTYNGNGNFGQDGKIDDPLTNNKLKIEFKNPEDARKVSFSPLIVSWNGRMIATTVFVNPDLLMPATSDYRNLSSEYIIQFRLNSAGAVSEWQTFYIVKPYKFPDLSDNISDFTFGEGVLGVRSPHGAMIVENLSLNNARHYSVSIKDCDPNTPGNQGYLPFVLMVKEDIIGKNTDGSMSMIDVSANGKHGGIGGGGGGGRFVDASFLGFTAEGEDGGDGFVAGGPGGNNKSANPALSDSYKNWGQGSGNDNGSLNGVPRPLTAGHESAGGGTGHPFGKSGKAAFGNQTNEENNAGGYGGGSGADQKIRGGSGGYSTEGSKSNAFNGGKIHGNRLGVPIAGGSGGASGNPQGIGAKSGNGGGGGGAIRIFAKTIKNLDILANGANGDSGDNGAHGGGGSGGYIGVFSKILAENISVSNSGGKAGSNSNLKDGGLGRLRLDLLREEEILISEDIQKVGEAMFFGFASDTTNLVSRNCFVSGKKGKDNNLIFYCKGESESNWKIVGTAKNDSDKWTQSLKLSGTDSVYYFVAINSPAGNPTNTEYQHTPIFDYSQAAYNILKIDKFPEIEAESTIHIVEPQCEGNKYKIVTKITNKGDAPLELNFGKAQFVKGAFFEVNQKDDIKLQPKESIDLVFTLKTDKVGEYEDKYVFTHNDKNAEQYPEWKISLKYELKEYDAEFRNETNKPIDTLDFGVICLGANNKPIEKNVKIANTSARAVEISSVKMKEDGNSFSIDIPLKTLEKGNNIDAKIILNATEPGKYAQTMYIQLKDCPELKDTLLVMAQLERPIINAEYDKDIGKICKNDIKKFNIKINNPTQLKYDLSAMKLEYTLDGIQIALSDNNKIMPAKSSKEIEITIDGSKFEKGTHTAAIEFPNASCADLDKIIFSFQIVGENLFTQYANQSPLDMGTIIINSSTTGKVTLQLDDDKTQNYEIVSIINPKAPFSVLSTEPPLPFILTKDNQLSVDIMFAPNAEGNFRDSVVVISKANGEMCADTISMHFIAKAVKEQINEMDFGKVMSCKFKELSMYIDNPLNTEITINSLVMKGKNPNNFTVVNIDPTKSFTIPVGGKQKVVVRYSPSPYTAGNLIHTAELQVISEQIPESEFKLKGEVEEMNVDFTLANGSDLSNGNVGDVRHLNVILVNHNSLPASVSLTSPNNNITLPTIPINVGAGATKIVQIACKVDKEGENKYVIELVINEPCDFSSKINFAINTKLQTKINIMLRVPDLIAQDPRDRNLSIPVYASFDNLPNDKVQRYADISFDISLNATMYYANRINKGEISNTLNGDQRVFRIKVPNVMVKAEEQVICSILGSALLGNSDSTTIAISNASCSPDSIFKDISLIDGKLTYKICQQGGDRLIHYIEPLSMKVSPNPASNMLELELNAFEKGKHTVELVNTLGEDFRLIEFDYNPDSPHKVNTSIPLNQYANGTYLLIFRGPNRLITKQLQIIK